MTQTTSANLHVSIANLGHTLRQLPLVATFDLWPLNSRRRNRAIVRVGLMPNKSHKQDIRFRLGLNHHLMQHTPAIRPTWKSTSTPLARQGEKVLPNSLYPVSANIVVKSRVIGPARKGPKNIAGTHDKTPMEVKRATRTHLWPKQGINHPLQSSC